MARPAAHAAEPDDDRPPPEPPRQPRRSLEREGCRRGPAIADEGIGGIVAPVRAKAPRSSSPTPATRLPREERKERSMTPRQSPSQGMQSRALVNSLGFSATSSTKSRQTAHDAPKVPTPLPVTPASASAPATASKTRDDAGVASATAKTPSPPSDFLASAPAAAPQEPRSKIRGSDVPDALTAANSTAASYAPEGGWPAMASRRQAAVDIPDPLPASQNPSRAGDSRSRASASASSAVFDVSKPPTTHVSPLAAASRSQNSRNVPEPAPTLSRPAEARASTTAVAARNQRGANVSSAVGIPLEQPPTSVSRRQRHSDIKVPSPSPLKPASATRNLDRAEKSPKSGHKVLDRLAEARSANDASSPKPSKKTSRGGPVSGKAAHAGDHQSSVFSRNNNSGGLQHLRYPAGDDSPLPLPPLGAEKAPHTAHLKASKPRPSRTTRAARAAAELAAVHLAPAGLTMPTWPAPPASLTTTPQPSARSIPNGAADVVPVPAPLPFTTPYMPLHTRSCSADFLGASLASAPGTPTPLTGRSISVESAAKWHLQSGATAQSPFMGLMNFWQRPGTPSTMAPGSMFAGELSARSLLGSASIPGTARSVSPHMLSACGRVTSAPLVRDASLGFMGSPLRNTSWMSAPDPRWPVDSSARSPASLLSHLTSPRPSSVLAAPQQLRPSLGLGFLESQLSSRQASPCASHRSLSLDAGFQPEAFHVPAVSTPMRGRRNVYSDPAGDAGLVPAPVAVPSSLHVNSCSAGAPAWTSPLPSYRGISSGPGLALFGSQTPTISPLQSPMVTPRRLGSLDQPTFNAGGGGCGIVNNVTAGIRSRPASIDGLPPSASLLPARGKRLFSDRVLSGESARLAASITLD